MSDLFQGWANQVLTWPTGVRWSQAGVRDAFVLLATTREPTKWVLHPLYDPFRADVTEGELRAIASYLTWCDCQKSAGRHELAILTSHPRRAATWGANFLGGTAPAWVRIGLRVPARTGELDADDIRAGLAQLPVHPDGVRFLVLTQAPAAAALARLFPSLSPYPSASPPQAWSGVLWPEWLPEAIREETVRAYSHRAQAPWVWASQWAREEAPPAGARLRAVVRGRETEGRWWRTSPFAGVLVDDEGQAHRVQLTDIRPRWTGADWQPAQWAIVPPDSPQDVYRVLSNAGVAVWPRRQELPHV